MKREKGDNATVSETGRHTTLGCKNAIFGGATPAHRGNLIEQLNSLTKIRLYSATYVVFNRNRHH